MPRRVPLTLEEHQRLSQHWHAIERELVAMFEIVRDNHLKAHFLDRFFSFTSPLNTHFHKFRLALEKVMFADLGGSDPRVNINVYFPQEGPGAKPEEPAPAPVSLRR
jgi:hypothetical protein